MQPEGVRLELPDRGHVRVAVAASRRDDLWRNRVARLVRDVAVLAEPLRVVAEVVDRVAAGSQGVLELRFGRQSVAPARAQAEPVHVGVRRVPVDAGSGIVAAVIPSQVVPGARLVPAVDAVPVGIGDAAARHLVVHVLEELRELGVRHLVDTQRECRDGDPNAFAAGSFHIVLVVIARVETAPGLILG